MRGEGHSVVRLLGGAFRVAAAGGARQGGVHPPTHSQTPTTCAPPTHPPTHAGMNETLCPCDFQQAGEIVDDDLNRALVNPLPQVGALVARAAEEGVGGQGRARRRRLRARTGGGRGVSAVRCAPPRPMPCGPVPLHPPHPPRTPPPNRASSCTPSSTPATRGPHWTSHSPPTCATAMRCGNPTTPTPVHTRWAGRAWVVCTGGEGMCAFAHVCVLMSTRAGARATARSCPCPCPPPLHPPPLPLPLQGTAGGFCVQFGASKDSQTAADTSALSGEGGGAHAEGLCGRGHFTHERLELSSPPPDTHPLHPLQTHTPSSPPPDTHTLFTPASPPHPLHPGNVSTGAATFAFIQAIEQRGSNIT